MREALNCPNCGAPITSAQCEYCGTLFYDFANVEIGKPSYLRLKIGDTLNIFKAVAEQTEIVNEAPAPVLYYDNQPLYIEKMPDWNVTISFRIVPDDRGILLERRKENKKHENQIS